MANGNGREPWWYNGGVRKAHPIVSLLNLVTLIAIAVAGAVQFQEVRSDVEANTEFIAELRTSDHLRNALQARIDVLQLRVGKNEAELDRRTEYVERFQTLEFRVRALERALTQGAADRE